MSYLYGYVWRYDGRVISEEREHQSHSLRFAVVTSEIMRRRFLLGLPQDSTVTILWRQTEKMAARGD